MDKRIIYQVVVAKTSSDNENWNYKTVYRALNESACKQKAGLLRKEHPEYAFIVLEKRNEIADGYIGWELDHDAGGEEVLEHY